MSGAQRRQKRIKAKDEYRKFVSEWKLEKKYNPKLKIKPTFKQWLRAVKNNYDVAPEHVQEHIDDLSWDDDE